MSEAQTFDAGRKSSLFCLIPVDYKQPKLLWQDLISVRYQSTEFLRKAAMSSKIVKRVCFQFARHRNEFPTLSIENKVKKPNSAIE
jgi:hypothetical protein